MEDLFQRSIEKAKTLIENSPTETLLTEKFFKEVFSVIKLTAPKINKSEITTSIGSETFSFNNVPTGVGSVNIGEPTDYALFGISIEGDIEIFKKRFGIFLSKNYKTAFINNGVLYIKEYSITSLLNNDGAINNVKTSAIQKINGIEAALTELAGDFDAFNASLADKIKNLSAAEVDKRKLKDETLDKLKLF